MIKCLSPFPMSYINAKRVQQHKEHFMQYSAMLPEKRYSQRAMHNWYTNISNGALRVDTLTDYRRTCDGDI